VVHLGAIKLIIITMMMKRLIINNKNSQSIRSHLKLLLLPINKNLRTTMTTKSKILILTHKSFQLLKLTESLCLKNMRMISSRMRIERRRRRRRH
jgi:hypothetical protein